MVSKTISALSSREEKAIRSNFLENWSSEEKITLNGERGLSLGNHEKVTQRVGRKTKRLSRALNSYLLSKVEGEKWSSAVLRMSMEKKGPNKAARPRRPGRRRKGTLFLVG